VFTESLERLLRDGIADGTLRPEDLRESATVLFNLVGWTYIHLRSGIAGRRNAPARRWWRSRCAGSSSATAAVAPLNRSWAIVETAD